jgi:hypothetical protein
VVTNNIEQSLAELEAMPETIASQVRGVPADRWEIPVWQGEGGWNRRQLLAHLASINLRHLIRVRLGAGLPEPSGASVASLPGIDDFNAVEVESRDGRSVDELLTEFRSTRGELVRLVRSLTPEQRQRFTMPRGNETLSLEQWAPFVVAHDRTHLAEILG